MNLPEIESIYKSIIAEAKLMQEQDGVAYSYDCAYIRLPEEVQKAMLEWIRTNIPSEWLYVADDDNYDGFGIEEDSHVTVLYGFDPENIDEQIPSMQKKLIQVAFQPVRFSLEEISMFTNDQYVVLKMTVQGKYLYHLHDYLKGEFHNQDKYDIYNPHATLCYIKKEHEPDIQQFLGDRIFNICELTARSFIYSHQGKQKFEIKLVAEQIENAKEKDDKVQI